MGGGSTFILCPPAGSIPPPFLYHINCVTCGPSFSNYTTLGAGLHLGLHMRQLVIVLIWWRASLAERSERGRWKRKKWSHRSIHTWAPGKTYKRLKHTTKITHLKASSHGPVCLYQFQWTKLLMFKNKMYRVQMKNSACVGCVHLLNFHLEAPFSRYISFLNSCNWG